MPSSDPSQTEDVPEGQKQEDGSNMWAYVAVIFIIGVAAFGYMYQKKKQN